jgi:hypothetical protein
LDTTKAVSYSSSPNILGGQYGLEYSPPVKKKILIAKGENIFEMTWSVSVNVNKKFCSPKIEEINYIDTDWDYIEK